MPPISVSHIKLLALCLLRRADSDSGKLMQTVFCGVATGHIHLLSSFLIRIKKDRHSIYAVCVKKCRSDFCEVMVRPNDQVSAPHISCESIYAKVTTVPVLPSSASMALIKSVSEKQTAKCSPFLRLWSASFSASSSEFGLSSIKQFTCGCARYSYNPAASFFQNH